MTPETVLTSRSLTALAAGFVLTGSLVAVAAGPAMAQTYPSPTPTTTTAPSSPTITIVYNKDTNTLTITVTGLKPGTTVIIVVVAQGDATGASYTPDGSVVIRTASYESVAAPTITTRLAASQSKSFSGVANASGVASVPVPLAAFGNLTEDQIAALQFSVQGTRADGTAYSSPGSVSCITLGTCASGPAAVTANGALPRTGSQIDVAPLIASGLGLLVVGGSIVMFARRRREDFVA
jgi:LPXTG-motif cell wall-anchored protein